MKKKLLLYYFISSIIIGTSIYIASKIGVNLPKGIRFYVNDFLIIPIVLTIALYCIRWLKGNDNYILPVFILIYISSLYSVLFEYFLPKFHSRYTTDIVDVALYFSGGIIFYVLQKMNINEI